MSDEKHTPVTRNGPSPRRPPLQEKHVIGFLFFICLLLTGFLGTLLLCLQILAIPDLRSVANYRPLEATIIYDHTGSEVERVFAENRTVVQLDQMHPLLPRAFVAAEDGRFFDHPGLDMFSVIRAVFANIRSGRKSQGGSTITQQVARALLLTPEKTYIRKFKEAILAWRIDTLLSKQDILYIYLNQIYLGEGAHGVEAASRVYFGKGAAALDLAEVALLAGLPQAPSRYSPYKNLELARMRQRYVLNRMVEDGYIKSDTAREAFERPLALTGGSGTDSSVNGYYLDAVKKEAAALIGRPLSRAGASIMTYLDQHLQHAAGQALASGLKAARSRQVLAKQGNSAAGDIPQGALVCLEIATGRVRALVGGANYLESPFNRATQARRPAGSVFKPFVYAAALESGWSPRSLISDAPLTVAGGGGRAWRPKNYTGEYHGQITLESALAHSYNVATIRLMQKVGVKPVHQLARDAGLTANLPPDLSLALGAVDVSPLEMTAAYTPFVNDGRYQPPVLLDTITMGDRRIEPGSVERRQVMLPQSAQAMRKMLETVITVGTGQRAGGLQGRSGGKTGTSDETRDAWFIGFHGRHLTGVWVGHDRNQPLGESESGGRTAAPIWREYMGRIAGK